MEHWPRYMLRVSFHYTQDMRGKTTQLLTCAALGSAKGACRPAVAYPLLEYGMID